MLNNWNGSINLIKNYGKQFNCIHYLPLTSVNEFLRNVFSPFMRENVLSEVDEDISVVQNILSK